MYKSYAEIVDLEKCRDLILVARDGKLESYTDGKFSVAQSVCDSGKVPVVVVAGCSLYFCYIGYKHEQATVLKVCTDRRRI